MKGEVTGYRHHPQLLRFREQSEPFAIIAEYLRAVHAESIERGYRFDAEKIAPASTSGKITVPQGQIDFEWRHLLEKLETRAPQWHARQVKERVPGIHPLFRVAPGGIASWERGAA